MTEAKNSFPECEGQWTTVGDAKCVAVFECDDPMGMAKYVQGWSDLLSIEIYPAIDNEALAKDRVTQTGGAALLFRPSGPARFFAWLLTRQASG